MPYTSDYPIFSVTVDVAALTVEDGALLALLVERGREPFRGLLALPGGFVEIDEDLEEAARRELVEETGLEAPALEQLGTYGAPGRDPRGRTVSVVHVALVPRRQAARAGDDAAAADWHAVDPLLAEPARLAFDHHRILTDAVEWVRRRQASP